jgi:hypothetical protein
MIGSEACIGKRGYLTYGEAKSAGNRLNRNRGGAKGNIYKCDDCRRFHVGNTFGKLKRYRFKRNKVRERLRNGREVFSD